LDTGDSGNGEYGALFASYTFHIGRQVDISSAKGEFHVSNWEHYQPNSFTNRSFPMV
jgi:hypothetical protein